MEKRMAVENSRREKRKQARMLRKQTKHKFWLENQKLRKLGSDLLRTDATDFDANGAQSMEVSFIDSNLKTSMEEGEVKIISDVELKPENWSKSLKKNLKKSKQKKTKLEEYLGMEHKIPTAEQDLEMERRLAKKLKVKNGKLGGDDDEINFLLGCSDQEYEQQHYDSCDAEILENKKEKKNKMLERDNEDCQVEYEVISFMENGSEAHDNPREDGEIESFADLKTEFENKDLKKKEKKVKEKRKKTKFEEYLTIENMGTFTTEEDVKMERRLAKKLEVKDGKLPGDDDGINFLFEDSELEYDQQGDGIDNIKGIETKKKKKKKKKRETLEQDMEGPKDDIVESRLPENTNPSESRNESLVNARAENANVEALRGRNYVAPHLRACSSIDPNDYSQIRRRIRGLLNRLSESNVESITGEISAVFQSIGRSVASQIVCKEVLASCAGGPRGNEHYAAGFAAFVAGLTCMVGIEFGAKLLAFLATSFEDEYLKEDNLSLRNLTLLLSYLYIFGVCSSELIYDFLVMLTKRMTEIDVSTILTILQCSGVKLRSDDPASMKGFILGVQNRVAELKASSGDEKANTNSRRMEFMLETICDIKNNKKRKEELPQHARVKKWLQQLRMDDFAIHGIKWSKLLDPEKKGQWWLTGDVASTDNVEEVASTIDKEVLEAQKMLELAALQRMNTDIRKAIFCVIMSGEDYLDAFEKLMRLDLQGKQDREIMRVLVECCLQEKAFNKYYTALAIKLCRHDKNHKFTLQYCLWDQFKELDKMPLMRSMHLAKFLVEMLVSFTLSLAVLKAVDLSDILQLTPKRIMHFRMLFEAVFEHPDNIVWNIFTRVAVAPELEALRTGMEFFIMEHVLPSNEKARQKFKVAKKALNNAEGVLM